MQSPSPAAPGLAGPLGVQTVPANIATSAASPQDGPTSPHEPINVADEVGSEVRPDGTFDLPERTKHSVAELARTMSKYSTHTDKTLANPIFDKSDPSIDPNHALFNERKWSQRLMHLAQHGPNGDKFKQRTAGVSFKNLCVYGYGSATDYQADVGNIWLKAFEGLKTRVGLSRQRRIDIVRNFDGLVKSGEMLAVLGRPGRYVGLHILLHGKLIICAVDARLCSRQLRVRHMACT